MADDFWYPTKEEILVVHDDIIEEDPESEPGIVDEGRIDFAIDYIEHGAFGKSPETVHEKAFHLMRLLASNHWFVDGNKRTALKTQLFYNLNGYQFEYGEDIRSMLKLFSVRESLIHEAEGPEYFADITEPVDVEQWDTSTALFVGLMLLAESLLDSENLDVGLDDYDPPELDDDSGETPEFTEELIDRTIISDDDEEGDEHGNG